MQKSNVPESIFFDKNIFSFPSFEDIGLDRKLARLGVVEPLVQTGDWVERNSPLLKIHLTAYNEFDKPNYFWKKDNTFTAVYELKSPIAGLVIDLKEAMIAYYSNYPTGVTPLVYGLEKVFPVLLVPREEPRWTEDFFRFYGKVYDFYRQHWDVTRYSHRDKGYIRLKEQFLEKDFDPPLSEMSRPSTFFEHPTEYSYPNDLFHNIEKLRAEYVDLRDKLLHLIRD